MSTALKLIMKPEELVHLTNLTKENYTTFSRAPYLIGFVVDAEAFARVVHRKIAWRESTLYRIFENPLCSSLADEIIDFDRQSGFLATKTLCCLETSKVKKDYVQRQARPRSEYHLDNNGSQFYNRTYIVASNNGTEIIPDGKLVLDSEMVKAVPFGVYLLLSQTWHRSPIVRETCWRVFLRITCTT